MFNKKIVCHFFKYFQMDVALNSFILKLINTFLNFQAISVYFIKFQETFVLLIDFFLYSAK